MKIKPSLAVALLLTLSACAKPEQQIFEAARTGDLEKVKKLVEAKPDLAKYMSKRNHFLTPLHEAGSVEVASYLIEQGADIQAQDDRGIKPIHTAANADIAKLLVQKGVSLEGDYYTYPPLYIAVMNDQGNGVRSMIAAGANPNWQMKDGKNYLHLAADNRAPSAMEALIESRVWLEAMDGMGATPLFYAVMRESLECTEALLKAGAQVNTKLSSNVKMMQITSDGPLRGSQDVGGATPLKIAKSDAMKELLKKYGATE